MTTSYSIENYSKKFEKINHELQAYWDMGREAARNVGIKINELVDLLHRQHQDWNVKKIAYTIAEANIDLEGFSHQVIYGHLNDDNKALLDLTKSQNRQHPNHSKNNVLEESVSDEQKHSVIEDSSNTDIDIPTDYSFQDAEVDDEDEDVEEQEEREVSIEKYKLLKQHIEEQNKQIRKLSETNERERSIKKQLPEEVVKIAEQVELSISKLELLTDPKLSKHPTIQISLVDTIKDFSLPKAIITIDQKIRDIETGALVKTGKDSYTIDYDKREKIDTRINVVKTSVEKYLEILDKAQGFMFSLTGHKITKDESEYEPKHIDHSEPYRIEILKGLSEQQKRTLFKDLTLISDTVDSFIDIIENESDGIKREQIDNNKNN